MGVIVDRISALQALPVRQNLPPTLPPSRKFGFLSALQVAVLLLQVGVIVDRISALQALPVRQSRPPTRPLARITDSVLALAVAVLRLKGFGSRDRFGTSFPLAFPARTTPILAVLNRVVVQIAVTDLDLLGGRVVEVLAGEIYRRLAVGVPVSLLEQTEQGVALNVQYSSHMPLFLPTFMVDGDAHPVTGLKGQHPSADRAIAPLLFD